MDNLEIKLKEIFSNDHLLLHSTCEEKLALVVAYFEAVISKLKNEINSKISIQKNVELAASERTKNDYFEKIESLKAEIRFLSEKNECQELMASNTLIYINKLSDEINRLKEMKAEAAK